MAVTIKDIANKVGVMPSTVSLVLNRRPKAQTFTEETREKIFKAAEELGYTPNAAARALATRKTKSLGFILSDEAHGGWANTYFAEYLNGVERCCREHYYSLNILLYNLSNIDGFIFPDKVKERGVDGIILNGYVSAEIMRKFNDVNIPCVSLGRNIEGDTEKIPTFSIDSNHQRMGILRYLSGLGHSQITLIDTDSNAKSRSLDKLDECLETSDLKGKIKVNRYLTDKKFSDIEDGKKFVRDFVATSPQKRPTAVISNERNALGIIKELSKHNMACPDDLSIISCSESAISQVITPALTAVKASYEEIGFHACKVLIDHLENNGACDASMSKNDFKTELVTRDSVQNISGN